MKRSRLIDLLSSLSVSEMREFCDYVRSPFFNKNKNLISLAEYLRKHHPEFDAHAVSDELISSSLFPAGKHDYFRIRNLTSDLLALAKDYLAQVYYRDESVFYPTCLLEKLREKNQNFLVEQSLKVFSRDLEHSKAKDEFYLLRQSELSQQRHFHSITKDPLGSHKLFQEDFDNFLEYSLLRLLKFYCIMLHDRVQTNLDFDMRMFDQVVDFVKDHNRLGNPTLKIYSGILNLVLKRTEKDFYRLKELKEEFSGSLSSEDRYMLDLYMSSFCADCFNTRADTRFQREHFRISKDQFDRNEMSVGRMLYPDFLIHVKIATRVGEYDWAEMFMQKYSEQLPEEDRQACLDFCRGYMSFYRGEYETALDLLSKAHFSKNLLKTQVKILILQCYCELGYAYQAFSFIESFRKFLERDEEIVSEYKVSFQKYLRAVSELLRIKEKGKSRNGSSAAAALKRSLDNGMSNLFGIKLWLREKLDEL